MKLSPGMSNRSFVPVIAFVVIAVATAVTPAANAGTQYRFIAPPELNLHAPADTRVVIPRVPLADGRTETLDVEPFDVWAPNAIIEIGTADGVQRIAPPVIRYFRGRVRGDNDSVVVLAVGATTEGLIIFHDRKFVVRNHVRRERLDRSRDGDQGSYIEELSLADQMNALDGGPWTCDVDQLGITKDSLKKRISGSGATDSSALPDMRVRSESLSTGTARYLISLAVISDNEFYAVQTSNATTYIGNLVAMASVIYDRDLQTNLQISYQRIYGAVATDPDPFTVVPGQSGSWTGGGITQTITYAAIDALLEFGDLWHANTWSSAGKKSAAVLVSGKSQRAGVAWTDFLCPASDFLCSSGNCGYRSASFTTEFDGHYAGPYAYNGGAGRDGSSVPDPNANTNYQATTSIFDNNYWSLLQFSHELGHIVQSPHTHCIGLTAGEIAATGRSFVDICYSGEGGCYDNGSIGATGSIPAELGTIMSYCHLNSGFGTDTRYTFGKATEVSHHVLDDMGAALLGASPTMSAITAPASVAANSTGNTASITAISGATYQWTITNGTITGGATSNIVTFTAGASGTTVLKVNALNSTGCGATDSASIPISSLAAPTGVSATAGTTTSITVKWNTTGAASYHVYRNSSQAPGWTLITSGLCNNPTGAGCADTVAAGYEYAYKVRSYNGSESSDSNIDLANTMTFTDPTITAQSTLVKAAHVTELRNAVIAVCAIAGYSPVWTTSPAVSGTIRAADVNDLRTNMDAARGLLGIATGGWTDSPVTAGSTTIKAAHISEIRSSVQ